MVRTRTPNMEYDQGQHGPSAWTIGSYIGAGIAAIIAITIIGGSWYTIGQYERGVLIRNGAFVKVLQPGLGFKWPWIEEVRRIDMQTETVQWKNMEAYSNDQQPAHMLVSVTFDMNETKISELYSRFQTRDNAEKTVIHPAVPKYAKIVFGQYSAQRAIQKRLQLNSDVEDAIEAALKDSVFHVRSVQIEDISFGTEYLKSIDARMRAEVEVSRQLQELEKEKVLADIKRANAQGEADKNKLIAAGEAEKIKLVGDAEAQAIRARGKALSENPKYIEMVQAERWNGHLPQTMIPGGAVPMLTLPK
jgi:regulator of protease activity HflC (stomatin/prohibitin superfamily)